MDGVSIQEDECERYCGLGHSIKDERPNEDSTKTCIIAGVEFHDVPGWDANSDGDIVFHALCNAISSITGTLILGGIADELCLKQGITDSEVYLKEALKTLGDTSIQHIAITRCIVNEPPMY